MTQTTLSGGRPARCSRARRSLRSFPRGTTRGSAGFLSARTTTTSSSAAACRSRRRSPKGSRSTPWWPPTAAWATVACGSGSASPRPAAGRRSDRTGCWACPTSGCTCCLSRTATSTHTLGGVWPLLTTRRRLQGLPACRTPSRTCSARSARAGSFCPRSPTSIPTTASSTRRC